MPEFSSPHTPGTFCWPELATTDQKGASAFYRGLFGWDVDDQPIGPGETYTMFRIRGKAVGAAYAMRAEERTHGIPPYWGSHIAVANADESAKKADALGGKVLAPPFDVMDVGRMAYVQDPTGAAFHIWQAKKHVGAEIMNEPGTLCWTELATRDTKSAERFYTQLFGWSAKTGMADSTMPYTEFSLNGTAFAGMMPIQPEWGNVPPYWMPYFATADCDATAAKTRQLGGSARVPPTDIPNVGRFAVLVDPQGATFAIVKIG